VSRRLVAVILVAGSVAAACGAPARDYPAAVCGEMDEWVEEVNASLDELSGGVEDRTTVPEETDAVIDHLDDVDAATVQAIEDLRDVASSDVGGADAFTDRLAALLQRVLYVASSIRDELETTADEGLEAFRDRIGGLLGRRLGGAIREVLAAPTDPASGDLADAFQEEPSCEDVLTPGEQETAPET
jgi:hypothetical protein